MEHEDLITSKETPALSEQQFEELRTNDTSESMNEFGPRVQMLPLKIHEYQDDD